MILIWFGQWRTFSKFIDLMAESIDFTTPAIDPVTCQNVEKELIQSNATEQHFEIQRAGSV